MTGKLLHPNDGAPAPERPDRREALRATTAPEAPPGTPPVQGEAPAIHHVDDHLLVCEKPAGLLAVPGRGEGGEDCLLRRLQAAWPGLEVVHRLDMATSGLMLFARDKAAQRALSVAFAERRVDKRYVAVVQGRVPPTPGGGWHEIALPLSADWPQRPRQKVDLEAGKPSLTRYRLLAHQGDRSRLLLAPVTGRSHQLRVHLLAIGHPIVGDALYAPAPVAAASPRLLLHASVLALEHPAGGGPLAFESPAPF